MRLIIFVICATLAGVFAEDADNRMNTTALLKNNKNVDTRIVNGQTTTISTAKYQLYMRRDGKFNCGCALVAPRKVLTAAHCVQGIEPSRIKIHGGTSYLSNEGETRAVIKVAISPNFVRKSLTSDVAVLTLAREMTGPNIAAIRLCSSPLKTGDTVKVSGWGLTKEDGKVSNQLRTVNLKMITKALCTLRYKGKNIITRTMMCATSAGGVKDSCSGDSGGPLVHNGELCGIVSFGVGCARSDYPGVYTSVNQVKAFIYQQLRN